MRLPELRTNLKKNNVIQMAMRGINYSASAQDGELAESHNISVRQYPYLTTRRRRDRQESYTGVTALSAWEKLIAVSGTTLLYDGTPVGTVTAGEKQFATVNNKIVIFPDKVYLDLTDMQVKPIDIEIDAHKLTFTTDTVSGYFGPSAQFPLVGIELYYSGHGSIVIGEEKIDESLTQIQGVSYGTEGIRLYLYNGEQTIDWSQYFEPGDKFVIYIGKDSRLLDREDGLTRYTYIVKEAGDNYIQTSNRHGGGLYTGANAEIWRAAENSLIDLVAYYPRICTFIDEDTSFDNTFTIPGNGDELFLYESSALIDGISYSECKKVENATVGADYKLNDILKDIDTIKIEGCETLVGNNKAVNILSLTENSITTTANAFTAGSEDHIRIIRKAPDLDFICAHENRLWGCNSEEQTIYISALGDPLNFITFEGVATDSFAVAVGTPGDFTGCTSLGSSVLFWKTNSLHKVLGSYPAEYALYTYEVEGVKAGCHKSQQVINDTLYYLGEHGVFAYNGGYPTLISPQFGEKVFSQGVAGNDGDSYYLSAMEGTTPHLLVYETRYGLWINEDNLRAVDFARIGKTLYCADDSGQVFIMDDGEEDLDIEWIAQFAPVYETIEGRKAYSKLNLRVHLPEGSYLVADVRIDGQVWQEAGRIVGSDADVSTMWIKFNRCDKFELKLYGHGPCTILGIMREFMVGSDM